MAQFRWLIKFGGNWCSIETGIFRINLFSRRDFRKKYDARCIKSLFFRCTKQRIENEKKNNKVCSEFFFRQSFVRGWFARVCGFCAASKSSLSPVLFFLAFLAGVSRRDFLKSRGDDSPEYFSCEESSTICVREMASRFLLSSFARFCVCLMETGKSRNNAID